MTAHTTTHMHSSSGGLFSSARGRLVAACASAVCAVLLASCARVPTSSEVFSQEINVTDPGNIFYQASGPRADASPREIVNGFVSAQVAAVTDNLSTAREFLTDKASQTWNPDSDMTVYSGDLNLAFETDETPENTEVDPDIAGLEHVVLHASAKSLGTIDASGVYTESLADANFEAEFELTRDANRQWRISGLRDGMVLSKPLFESNFRSVAVYFLSPDERYLVPDVRWVWRARSETYAVLALLNGPNSWLQDSVHSAIPEGTRLLFDSVSLEGGTATVNLSREVYAASIAERSKMATQIHTTLLRIPGVRKVVLQADSMELTADVDEDIVRDPNRATGAATSPVVYTDGKLYSIKGKELEPVEGVGSLSDFDVTALAIPEAIVGGVFRDGADKIRRMPSTGKAQAAEGEQSADSTQDSKDNANDSDNTEQGEGKDNTNTAPILLTGNSLTAPSMDPYGWVWSGERWQDSKSGELALSTRTGTIATIVPVSWLAGRELVSVRVSHDGTRLAVVSRVDGATHIEVAGIVRDTLNTPLHVSDPISVGGQIASATAIQWMDEANLWVIGETPSSGAVSLFSVPISGQSDVIAPADGAESLAAGRGLRAVVLGTSTGVIRTRASTGASWSDLSLGVRFPTLPG